MSVGDATNTIYPDTTRVQGGSKRFKADEALLVVSRQSSVLPPNLLSISLLTPRSVSSINGTPVISIIAPILCPVYANIQDRPMNISCENRSGKSWICIVIILFTVRNCYRQSIRVRDRRCVSFEHHILCSISVYCHLFADSPIDVLFVLS